MEFSIRVKNQDPRTDAVIVAFEFMIKLIRITILTVSKSIPWSPSAKLKF